jgi:thiamine-phosphate pyrophosphorylase
MVITNRRLAGGNLEKLLKKAVECGVRCIQLREKDLNAFELLSLSKGIRKSNTLSKLIINDRLDIALLSGADGVHASSYGINAKDIKRFGAKLISGKSVHSAEDAKKAEDEGFDYVLFGPVFKTPGKGKFGNPKGLDELRRVSAGVKIPVLAVGGITPLRAKRCIDAGAYGVAAIRSFMKAGNIKKTIMEFRIALGSL